MESNFDLRPALLTSRLLSAKCTRLPGRFPLASIPHHTPNTTCCRDRTIPLPCCSGASNRRKELPTIEGRMSLAARRSCGPGPVWSSETPPLRLRERVSSNHHQSLRDCHSFTKRAPQRLDARLPRALAARCLFPNCRDEWRGTWRLGLRSPARDQRGVCLEFHLTWWYGCELDVGAISATRL